LTRKRLGNYSNRVNDDESKQKRKQRIYELYTNEKKRWDEIAKIMSLSETTIDNVKRELIKDGKLTRDKNTGRIKKSIQQKTAETFEILEKTDFVKKYESVQNMAEKCKLLKGGVDVLSGFYVVCNTLGCSPDAFLLSERETVKLYDEFVDLFLQGKAKYIADNNSKKLKSGDNTSHIRYSKAVRKFCSVNYKPISENIGGNLTGKKENYGAYSTVKLSDQEFFQLLDFMSQIDDGHNDEWRALTAFTHDAYPRPSTAILYTWNMNNVQKVVDDIITNRLVDRIYEPKQEKQFPKWIYRKESLESLEYLSNGKRIINHLSPYVAKKTFARHLREFYHHIGKIELGKKYMKGIDTEPFYFNERPIHSLRHSGAHFSMRNSGFNATVVMKFGWDDPAMILSLIHISEPTRPY